MEPVQVEIIRNSDEIPVPLRSVETASLCDSHEGLVVGAKVDGELVGIGCVRWHQAGYDPLYNKLNDVAILDSVQVLPGYRGRGIGKALVDAREQIAREKGRQWLGAGVACSNRISRRMLRRAGFNRFSIMPHRNPAEPSIWGYYYVKRLG